MTAPAVIEQDPLEELKKLRKAAPQDTTDPLDALKSLKAAASEGEPGVGSKILGAIASASREIPGVEAAQAGVRSLIRGQSYRDALSDIHNAEDAAPKFATVPARIAGGAIGAMALPGGAIKQGLLYGGLSGALQANPDAGVADRVISSAGEAAIGGTLGAAAKGISLVAGAPKGAIGKVAKRAILPDKWRRAAEEFREATAPVRPKVRLADASIPAPKPEIPGEIIDTPVTPIRGPKATPVQQDWRPSIGLLEGSGFKNVGEAAKHQTPFTELRPRGLPQMGEEALVPESKTGSAKLLDVIKKQRTRTNRQFNADRERFGLNTPVLPEAQGRPVEFAAPGSPEDAAQADLLMQQLIGTIKKKP